MPAVTVIGSKGDEFRMGKIFLYLIDHKLTRDFCTLFFNGILEFCSKGKVNYSAFGC